MALWQLGRHRLLLGNSRRAADVRKLLGERTCDVIIADPPYSSGSYQDSGKVAGSKGSKKRYTPMAGDVLPTWGYMTLLRDALRVGADFVYLFLDWKMWTATAEVLEGDGYLVRSMLVWDKLSIGMGHGWRRQHELIMCGVRPGVVWPKGWAGAGDVIGHPRVRNEHHPTQKPQGLIRLLLDNTPRQGGLVYDPFAGSGTTLFAAEESGYDCAAMEVDPQYVEGILERWRQAGGEVSALREGRAAGARARWAPTAASRAARNASILTQLRQNVPRPQIAENAGVSESTISRVAMQLREGMRGLQCK